MTVLYIFYILAYPVTTFHIA